MKSIVELIADIPTNAVLRLRAQALEKKIGELETENARLVKRVAELERQVLSSTSATEFVEHRGALFKRKIGGGYSDQPYCFVCKKPLSSHMGMLPFICFCGYSVGFSGAELRDVMRDLT
jgi:hypothetical protein